MAQVVVERLSFENPLFRIYAFNCCILALKMLFMSILTATQRMKTKAFANPEDAVGLKGKVRVDENVERVRRAHLNDLENIPVFFVVSLIYILTNPSVFFATMLFRIFTIARVLHTFVYTIVIVPQPARALSFGVGVLITVFMAIYNVVYLIVE